MSRFNWRDEASCKGMPLEMFFPEIGVHSSDLRELCFGCSVQADCLTHAVAHEKDGYWAGTTAEDRDRIRGASKVKLSSPETLNVMNRCGTDYGYTKHFRNKTVPCAACSKEHSRANRERKQRNRR